jgi:hypothetical protein
MNMQKLSAWIGAVVMVIIVVVIVAALGVFNTKAPSTTVSNAEDTAIRSQVTGFGAVLQNVSLLAPSSDRKAAMDQYYSSYVAPELLMQWYSESDVNALGRQTSSPWPDRIEIVNVTQNGDKATVEGNIVEVANGQNGNKDVIGVLPVTLSMEKRAGHWLIIAASKGSYSELPQQQTLVGTWECLPHKDTTGPQTMECAFGIFVDETHEHYAVDTSLMSTYPVDYPTSTKVRASGIVTPVEQLSSVQKYNIAGILRATVIEKI